MNPVECRSGRTTHGILGVPVKVGVKYALYLKVKPLPTSKTTSEGSAVVAELGLRRFGDRCFDDLAVFADRVHATLFDLAIIEKP